MGLIKLTGVPDDVHRRLKADAAAHGLTLTQWCIDKLSATDPLRMPYRFVNHEELAKITRVALEQAVERGLPVRESLRREVGCKSCGGLNGLHQKDCKA